MSTIQVLSRTNARIFRSDVPWAAISVSTFPDEFAHLDENNRIGLLQLSFWDIASMFRSKDDEEPYGFTPEQAKKVVEFVDEFWDKADVLLVHCEAGLSRSPAIAAAIARWKNGRQADNEYFRRFQPNSHVYKTLLETAHGMGREIS